MRPRFSLRVLLIVFTLTAILFGGAAQFVWSIKLQSKRHKEAVTRLKLLGVAIETDDDWAEKHGHPKSSFVKFARAWIDADAYRDAPSFGWLLEPEDRATRDETAIRALREMRNVHGVLDVTLAVDCLTVAMMKEIARRPLLRTLAIRYESAQPEAEKLLSHFRELQELYLEGSASDEAITSLECLEKLKLLSLETTRLHDASLVRLAKCRSLERIEVRGELKESGLLDALKNCPKLERLTLISCRLSPEAARPLESLAQLKQLFLEDQCQVPELLFLHVSKLKSLVILDVDDTKLAVKSPYVGSLAKCNSLESLRIKKIELSEDDFVALSKLPSLETLHCQGIFTSESIAAFLKGKERRHLSVFNSQGKGLDFGFDDGQLTSWDSDRRVFVFNYGLFAR